MMEPLMIVKNATLVAHSAQTLQTPAQIAFYYPIVSFLKENASVNLDFMRFLNHNVKSAICIVLSAWDPLQTTVYSAQILKIENYKGPIVFVKLIILKMLFKCAKNAISLVNVVLVLQNQNVPSVQQIPTGP